MRFLHDWISIKRRNRILVLLILAVIVSITSKAQISVGQGTAPVSVPAGGFKMNGLLKVNSGGGDWLPGSGNGGNVLKNDGTAINTLSTFHIVDAVGTTDNVFGGGMKINGNPNSWAWKTAGASPSKCNINHAVIHIAKDLNTGDTWITMSGDRESVNGNSFISLSLHQKTLKLGTTTFISDALPGTGGRSVGDVQISAEFTGGGVNPNLYLEEWKSVSGTYMWAPITIQPGKIVAYGKTNDGVITGMPYTVFNNLTSYQINSFIEVSFNISEIYRSSSTPCVGSIKSMLLLTKSSQSVTADLADFVTPQQVDLNITVGAPAANGANYCVGDQISPLTATKTTGASLNWYTALDPNDKPTGTPFTGDSYTTGITGSSKTTGTYYVTQSLDGCESKPTAVTVNVNAVPTAYTLSGNSVCSSDGTGSGGVLTLNNSQTGFTYQLKKKSDNSNVQAAQAGSDGTALQWSNIPYGVVYNVVATGASPTNCSSTSNDASVTGANSPTVFTLSGNSICASAPGTGVITLSNSQMQTSYQLKKTTGNTDVQSAKAGTGTSLQWTGLPAGVSYYVVATGAAPTNCTSQTGNASITEVANPDIFTLSGNSICASTPNTGVITLSSSVSGVSYQLKNATDNSIVQNAKAGNGSSLQWTALPAGVNYYVEATGAVPTSCTTRTANASVTEVANPNVYTLSGNSICSADPNTGVITLNNSQTGFSYQLKKTSDNGNVQSAQAGTNNTQLHWTDLPAGVSYYVEATGASGTSCKSVTGSASVSESQNPAQPELDIVNPSCSKSTGTITVLTPKGTGLEYSFNGGSFTTSVGPYTFQAGAGYKIEVKNTASGCISIPAECSAEVKMFSSNSVIETNAVIPGPGKTKVLAAPNPFSDRVKFTMESGISGQGSLEIYNSLGQRLKVVYEGFIEAGKPFMKEFTVPTVQRGMLVYVFRVGNERVTGKLISSR